MYLFTKEMLVKLTKEELSSIALKSGKKLGFFQSNKLVNQEFTDKKQESVALNSGGRAELAEMILNIESQGDSNAITGALENALKNLSIGIKQDFDKVNKDLGI